MYSRPLLFTWPWHRDACWLVEVGQNDEVDAHPAGGHETKHPFPLPAGPVLAGGDLTTQGKNF